MNRKCFSVGLSPNDSSSINSSSRPNLPCPSGAQFAAFIDAAYVAAIYLSIVSVLTIAANLPLFAVFVKNPKKVFRTPTAYFLVGIALADVITAAMVEPCFYFCFFRNYVKGIGDPFNRIVCPTMLNLATATSAITMNASFLTVLAFTVAQYLVVASPLKIARQITATRVLIIQAFIWIYCLAFGLGFTLAGELKRAVEIDVYVHNIAGSALMLTFYALLFRAFRRKMAHSVQLQSESSTQRTTIQTRRIQLERKFVNINSLLIAVLIGTTIPKTILHFVELTKSIKHLDRETTMIYHLALDCIVFTKFLLDPFVYVWRFSAYRTAMRHICCCCCSHFVNGEAKFRQNTSNLSLAHYQHKTSTVTLSFVQTNVD